MEFQDSSTSSRSIGRRLAMGRTRIEGAKQKGIGFAGMRAASVRFGFVNFLEYHCIRIAQDRRR